MEDVKQKKAKLEQIIKDMEPHKLDRSLEILQSINNTDETDESGLLFP